MSQSVPMDRNQLYTIFSMVDNDKTGYIGGRELQCALSNGTYKPFNGQTVRLMIKMFDKDNSGSINFAEFEQLWRYVNDWLNCFNSFDSDRSGSVDKTELCSAFSSFGYRFSQQFYDQLIRKFDSKVNFDDFILLCVYLQTLTQHFRNLDTDMDGVINITYEQFVSLIFDIVIQK